MVEGKESNVYAAKVIHIEKDYPWIVLLHGFGGSAKTWKKQQDVYATQYNQLLIEFHVLCPNKWKEPLTVEGVCEDIAATMAHYKIKSAHFVCMSHASMIALAFASYFKEQVLSMVLAGGIIKFNLRTSFLLTIARKLKNKVSYMYLYRFFAWIILPRRNHKISRRIFIAEAQKMGIIEFRRWVDFIPILRKNEHFIEQLNNGEKHIPILYIMGSQDHLFLSQTTRLASTIRDTKVQIIPNCGHVCSIEKDKEFTEISMAFLNKKGDLF